MLLHARITFESSGLVWLWLALAVIGGGVMFRTYLAIFERSQRWVTWALMLLRAAGIAALLLALAKPTWTRDRELVDPGRLAIVLDDSISMSLRDASGRPRWDRAREAMAALAPVIESPGSPRMAVEWFDIQGRPLAAGGSGSPDLPSTPRAERTDLARALSETTRQLRAKPLVGIVLVSDGMDNSGQTGLVGLDRVSVPVYAVGFEAEAAGERYDVALRSVTAPERVIAHNEAKVELLLAKSGGPAVELPVAITRSGRQLAMQKVALPAGDAEQRVAVPFTPREPGRFVFTATVQGDAAERLTSNNAQHFPLRVDSEPIRVFYAEGFLRWEYTYLRRLLEEDADVGAVTAVRRQNPELTDATGPGDLLTPDRLAALDVVLLGDMEASYMTAAEYQALIRWVDGGKSLLVIGGYRSFGAEGFRASPLADVLPVVFADAEPIQMEDSFQLKLSDEGRRHPIFRLTGDQAKDAEMWDQAPALSGCARVARAKPGATVLAVNPAGGPAGQALPVLVTHRYGKGHATVFTADTTWRWTRLPRLIGQSDTLYRRFWGQTIRWLAGREATDERPLLTVNTDRPEYDTGKRVTVQLSRPAGRGAGTVQLEVTDEAGKTTLVPLAASSADPDVLTGSLFPASSGRYVVRASVTTETGTAGPKAEGKPTETATNDAVTEFVVHGSGLELADTRTNGTLLRDLAARTGGVYVGVDQVARLADRIERRERRIDRVLRTEFWDSPWLFLAFLAAVTIEWVIRRRTHLV
jgi:uncharacterized membrane protein